MKRQNILIASFASIFAFGFLMQSAIVAEPYATEQKIFKNQDGTTVNIDTDGSKTITDPDGSIIQLKPDGTKIIKKADGSTIEIGSDGSKVISRPDGSTIQINKPNTQKN